MLGKTGPVTFDVYRRLPTCSKTTTKEKFVIPLNRCCVTCCFPWDRVHNRRRVVLRVAGVAHVCHAVIRQIDKQLSEATLCCRIVSENSGKGRIAQGLGKALAEGLSCSGIVTEAALG